MATKSDNGESDILKKHERLVRHVARPFSGGATSIDDLIQEGRIALLGALRRYRAEEGARLWTYARISVFAAIERCSRADRAQMWGPLDEEEHDAASDAPSPEDDLELAECTAFVLQEVAKLAPEEQDVIRLSFLEQRTLREISKEMGYSLGHSHEMLHSAIHTLRGQVAA